MLKLTQFGAMCGFGMFLQARGFSGRGAAVHLLTAAVVVSALVVVVVRSAVLLAVPVVSAITFVVSVTDTETKIVSVTSGSIDDVDARLAVDSPTSVGAAVVSRLVVTMDDEGRQGPALTPEKARRTTDPARMDKRGIVTRD